VQAACLWMFKNPNTRESSLLATGCPFAYYRQPPFAVRAPDGTCPNWGQSAPVSLVSTSFSLPESHPKSSQVNICSIIYSKINLIIVFQGSISGGNISDIDHSWAISR